MVIGDGDKILGAPGGPMPLLMSVTLRGDSHVQVHKRRDNRRSSTSRTSQPLTAPAPVSSSASCTSSARVCVCVRMCVEDARCYVVGDKWLSMARAGTWWRKCHSMYRVRIARRPKSPGFWVSRT